jgi:hypothetical protein
MHGVDANAWALHSRGWPGQGVWSAQPTDAGGDGRLYANRAAVGPWERFDVRDVNNNPISPTGQGSTVILAHEHVGPREQPDRHVRGIGHRRTDRQPHRRRRMEKFTLVLDGQGGVASPMNRAHWRSRRLPAACTVETYQSRAAPDEIFDVLHL